MRSLDVGWKLTFLFLSVKYPLGIQVCRENATDIVINEIPFDDGHVNVEWCAFHFQNSEFKQVQQFMLKLDFMSDTHSPKVHGELDQRSRSNSTSFFFRSSSNPFTRYRFG